MAWLAGLLEGEGSFMMTSQRHRGRVYRYPKIVVNMTDQDVIARAAAMFGTSIYALPPRVGYKQQWRATANGSYAAAWMCDLYPWLGLRRRARVAAIFSEYERAGDFPPLGGESKPSHAWLAGLLEGEGYFGMIRNRVGGKTYRYPRIGVSMTDRDVIARVATMFGLGTYEIKAPGNSHGRLDSYRAWSTGEAGAEWMRSLRSLMGERRRDQIDTVLTEWDAREPAQIRRSRSCREAALKRAHRADGTFERSA
jgi:hypothetical protein